LSLSSSLSVARCFEISIVAPIIWSSARTTRHFISIFHLYKWRQRMLNGDQASKYGCNAH
jgi:hypothetical protein